MNPTSIFSWLMMIAAVLTASGAGLAIVRAAPWSEVARRSGMPQATALAIGPFLLGLMGVLALGLFRGASHSLHLIVVFSGLLLLCAAGFLFRRRTRSVVFSCPNPLTTWEWVFGGILVAWILALLVNTATLPLVQNDSLEYATVGRSLFETRDLMVYPAVHPEAGRSGFYGPWTHPPLYVALVYLAYTFQGNAETPGMIRWISPWFALAGTGLVFAIGRLKSRLCGLLAALVFISIPLFFLGAGSATIDPLPVLGMTVVFTAIIGTEGSPMRRGVCQGAALGVALWTHSQGILFIPLTIVAVALYEGFGDRRALVRQFGMVLLIAVPVAFWPYFRNFQIYGALVSDTPPVFAMSELAWDEYFRISRVIDSLPDRIQYGLFKGWFALESYSFTFWLMTIGLALLIHRITPSLKMSRILRRGLNGVKERWLVVAAIILACYFGGVLASMLLGIDLMIRNERYWLVLIPFVSLFCASGLAEIRDYGDHNLVSRRVWVRVFARLARAVYPASAVLLVLQVVILMVYGWAPYAKEKPYFEMNEKEHATIERFFGIAGYETLSPDFLSNPVVFGKQFIEADRRQPGIKRVAVYSSLKPEDRLRWPNMLAMHYLQTETPENATVLSFRPADFYYAGRRMISCFDPRLLTVYREKNVLEVWNLLRRLGIDYIYVPDYYNPCIYNSAVLDILARPDLTGLVFSTGGSQIYRLARTDAQAEGSPVDFTPGTMPWTKFKQMTGGRKALASIQDYRATFVMSQEVSFADGITVFQRDWSTTWVSGLGTWEDPLAPELDVPVSGGREHRLEMTLEGHALVKIWLMQQDSKGQFLTENIFDSMPKVKIGELVLGPTYPERNFIRRFIAHPMAAYIRVGIEHGGSSRLRIKEAKLTPIIEIKQSSR